MPEARTLTLTARKPLADGVNTEPIQVVLTKANVPGDGQATPIANPKPTSCELITNETLPSRSATEPFLVWKGTLKRSDEAQVTRVVCKIALKFNRAPERLEDLFQMYPKQPSTALSALEKEAGLYCGELKVLQGEVVPRFYGYYKGKIARCDINSGGGRNHPGSTLEGFEEAMACIILEDGGENVPEELLKEDPLIVDTVIGHYRKIHEVGLETPFFFSLRSTLSAIKMGIYESLDFRELRRATSANSKLVSIEIPSTVEADGRNLVAKECTRLLIGLIGLLLVALVLNGTIRGYFLSTPTPQM